MHSFCLWDFYVKLYPNVFEIFTNSMQVKDFCTRREGKIQIQFLGETFILLLKGGYHLYMTLCCQSTSNII